MIDAISIILSCALVLFVAFRATWMDLEERARFRESEIPNVQTNRTYDTRPEIIEHDHSI
jgi:hypothetical protein